MTRSVRRAALLSIVLIAGACTGSPSKTTAEGGSGALPYHEGGTLKAIGFAQIPNTLDPQEAYSFDAWELFRCCLLRTLMSYKGKPTDQGGADVRPDLASGFPTVSANGLTWTFHVKPGLHYGPPFQDTEIKSADIIRALQREADPKIQERAARLSGSSYSFYFSVIRGFDDFSEGRAPNISGLQAPNDQTLRVQLTQPAGDLGFRLSLPATAPIPPGAAEGHSDYGPFLVASGPYMLLGSQRLTPSMPIADQRPVAGYVPFRVVGKTFEGGSVRLVRNPSWHRASDQLRGAYVDAIDLALGPHRFKGTDFQIAFSRGYRDVLNGAQDLVLDTEPVAGDLTPYRADPSGHPAVQRDQSVVVYYMAMNLAVPPFDDLHVRKAVSLAVDKAKLQSVFRLYWTANADVASHMIPDSAEDNILLSYRPRWDPPGERADLKAARNEMRRSRYDRNGDGRCDAHVCRSVGLLADDGWIRQFDGPVRASLRAIGIDLNFRRFSRGAPYNRQTQPSGHWAMTANRWAADYPNGSNFFPNLFFGETLGKPGTFDFPLLGATPDQLHQWGYRVTGVPNVDDRIKQCMAEGGDSQSRCWAMLDKYLMEHVVPWVPFLFERSLRTISPRVAHFSFDQFVTMPALDQIALKPSSA